ncbi:MAG: hypothetical protein ATN35_02725 [Epulopiscium sp. Nele67-Bin004]|nr:MAG: hypothetical protein ATN35_02725 [Epulopiscium sp. Nele67-Bin004]
MKNPNKQLSLLLTGTTIFSLFPTDIIASNILSAPKVTDFDGNIVSPTLISSNEGIYSLVYTSDDNQLTLGLKFSTEIDINTPTIDIPDEQPDEPPITVTPDASGDIRSIFSDIPSGAWYCVDVANVYNQGIMTGISNTEFGPQNTANRAMMAAILHRMDDSATLSLTNSFSDVVSGAWYEASVNWAVSAGVYGGFEDGTFRPNDPITREQLVTIMYNYATYRQYDISTSADISTFSDGNSVAAWASTAMEWAVGNGIVGGKDGNLLDPKGTATRAEIAAIINRFLSYI